MKKTTLTHEERDKLRKEKEAFLKYCIECEGKAMNNCKK
jgi:hypothetical protein